MRDLSLLDRADAAIDEALALVAVSRSIRDPEILTDPLLLYVPIDGAHIADAREKLRASGQ
jgi:hypothetical protein